MAAMNVDSEGPSHLVRYFSSWFESGQLFIQMELCQGSLRDEMSQHALRPDDPRFSEGEIREVIRHVASGLDAMHRSGFVHLDIKPDNIMLSRGSGKVWKIGDLGLAVAALDSQCDDVCEGDCRYLAKEVLHGCLSNLASADVFSLGVMSYELARNPDPLPGQGDEWHRLREGSLDFESVSSLSDGLRDLLQQLVRPDPDHRPSCGEILRHPALRSSATQAPGADQDLFRLREELAAQRQEAELLAQRAQEYKCEMDNMRRQCVADEVRRLQEELAWQRRETEMQKQRAQEYKDDLDNMKRRCQAVSDQRRLSAASAVGVQDEQMLSDEGRPVLSRCRSV